MCSISQDCCEANHNEKHRIREGPWLSSRAHVVHPEGLMFNPWQLNIGKDTCLKPGEPLQAGVALDVVGPDAQLFVVGHPTNPDEGQVYPQLRAPATYHAATWKQDIFMSPKAGHIYVPKSRTSCSH